MLLDECETAGVDVRTHCEDTSVEPGFEGALQPWLRFGLSALVIASGGLSIPKMGASDFGYKVARQFGHEVLETRAGLVPFTFTGPCTRRLRSHQRCELQRERDGERHFVSRRHPVHTPWA